MRFFIEIAYKGTNYHGWQIQSRALGTNTVQQEINNALSKVLQCEINTTGSSRTDTGVHALQQFVHFDTSAQAPLNPPPAGGGTLPPLIVPPKSLPKGGKKVLKESRDGQINGIQNISNILYKLNCILPEDIVIKNIYKVKDDGSECIFFKALPACKPPFNPPKGGKEENIPAKPAGG